MKASVVRLYRSMETNNVHRRPANKNNWKRWIDTFLIGQSLEKYFAVVSLSNRYKFEGGNQTKRKKNAAFFQYLCVRASVWARTDVYVRLASTLLSFILKSSASLRSHLLYFIYRLNVDARIDEEENKNWIFFGFTLFFLDFPIFNFKSMLGWAISVRWRLFLSWFHKWIGRTMVKCYTF